MANISTVPPYATATRAEAQRPGRFHRFIAAIMESQQRKADREVAAILAFHAANSRPDPRRAVKQAAQA